LKSYGSLTGLYVAPNIPERKTTNAGKKCRVPADDRIVALIDCTAWGSASDALVFGSHAFYYHNSGGNVPDPGCIPYHEFPEIVFGKTWVNCITLGRDRYCNKAGNNISREKIIEMLDGVKRAVVESGAARAASPV